MIETPKRRGRPPKAKALDNQSSRLEREMIEDVMELFERGKIGQWTKLWRLAKVYRALKRASDRG